MKTLMHAAVRNLKLRDESLLPKVFNCRTMKELCKSIEKTTDDYAAYGYSDIYYPDGRFKTSGKNKMKGDLFEIFAECFYKLTEENPEFAIRYYEPIPQEYDDGVDAKGLNNKNEIVTISIKYRTRIKKTHDLTNTLTLSDLGQFISWSQNGPFEIPSKAKNRMIVFTTFDDMSYKSNQKMTQLLTVHSWDKIRYVTDGMNGFWESLLNLIKNS